VVQDSTSTRYELGPATLRLGLATLCGSMPSRWPASACPP